MNCREPVGAHHSGAFGLAVRAAVAGIAAAGAGDDAAEAPATERSS
jgi:hypothetical protein